MKSNIFRKKLIFSFKYNGIVFIKIVKNSHLFFFEIYEMKIIFTFMLIISKPHTFCTFAPVSIQLTLRRKKNSNIILKAIFI